MTITMHLNSLPKHEPIPLGKTIIELFDSVDPHEVIDRYQNLWDGRGNDYYDDWCYPLSYFYEISQVDKTPVAEPWRVVVGRNWNEDNQEWDWFVFVTDNSGTTADATRYGLKAFNGKEAPVAYNYQVYAVAPSIALVDEVEIAAILYDELGWWL